MRLGSILATTALGLMTPLAASAQEDPAPTEEHSPEVAALIAEIYAISDGDQSADPAGDLVKLADVRARIEASDDFPILELGSLASAEGASYFYLREFDRAAELYGQATEYFIAGNAPPEDMAGLYNNRASILASIGRYDEAEADHRAALAIRRELEGERGVAVSSSLFGIGYVYFRQGRIEESIPFLRESAEQQLEFAGPEAPLTIIRVTSLASVLGRSGRTQEALQVARQAEGIAREHLGLDHPTYAITLNNLGNALFENSLYHEAVPVLRQTLELRLATVGENASGTAITLRNLASALNATGAVEEAEVLTLRALTIFEETGEVDSPFVLPYMYSELAGFAADRGEWEDYFRLSDQAISLGDAALNEENFEQAQMHIYRAERLLEYGDTEAALAEAERWAPVMQSELIPSHPDRLYAEMLLARLRQLGGAEREEVIPAADLTFATLEAKLADLSVSDAALVREAQSHRETALLYLAIASDYGDAERTFSAMQLANISELSRGQQFAQSGGGDESGALALRNDLLDAARLADELRARLEAAQSDPDADTGALVTALAEAEAAELAAREELQSAHPEFVARYRPRPVPLAQFSERLGATDLFIAPVEGDGETWIVTLNGDSLTSRSVASADVGMHVAALRDGVDRPDPALDEFPLSAASDLFSLLFPEGLGSSTRIFMHGGRQLASIPLGILLTDSFSGELADAPWLVRDASVQVIGSLALFDGAAPNPRVSGTRFVGIGGVQLPASEGAPVPQASLLFRSGRPDGDTIEDLPYLPNAAAELSAIGEAFPEDMRTLLLGSDAAESNFKATPMDGVGVLAFATHGLVAGELTGLWEPALLLGTDDPALEDGLLGASEIARLSLEADWVVLSACNTAAGSIRNGPSYSGLATAFAQSGAQSLLLSHWRIRDDAAAYVTVRTITNARDGTGRAEALRQAQLELLGDREVEGGAHPAIWAPFVYVGS